MPALLEDLATRSPMPPRPRPRSFFRTTQRNSYAPGVSSPPHLELVETSHRQGNGQALRQDGSATAIPSHGVEHLASTTVRGLELELGPGHWARISRGHFDSILAR